MANTNNQVSITIRSSDGIDDYSLACDVEWSISQLKEVIRNVHPLKPEISSQKLFYQDAELQPNQMISSFLKMSDDLHVIKLILTMQGATTADQANSEFVENTGLRRRQVRGTVPPSFNNPWMQWQQNPMAAYYHQYSYPQLSMNNDNYAAMWQQYQQNYMNYYDSLSQTQTGTQSQPSPPVTQTDGANPPAAAPADPPPQGNPPEANPPMNAQGGFVAPDNDDLLANDWLDVLFAMFRYAFFFSIIYFYSSFWRFVLVASFFFLLYIYQSGIFRAQRRPALPDEVERRDNDAGGAEPENTDDNNNDSANDENAENETEEQEVPPPPPPSIFATAWCFITTFFSSLIPQPPPVV